MLFIVYLVEIMEDFQKVEVQVLKQNQILQDQDLVVAMDIQVVMLEVWVEFQRPNDGKNNILYIFFKYFNNYFTYFFKKI
jgi:hypothetical protein